MKTLETIKRFLAPIGIDRAGFLGFLIRVSAWPLESIIITLLLAQATKLLENGTQSEYFLLLRIYGAFIIVYQTYNFLMRNFGARTLRGTQSHLLSKYLGLYINVNNSEVEKIGTGKMISIIDKGVDQWSDLLIQLIWRGTWAAVQLIFVSYLVFQITWYYPLILNTLLSIVIIVTIYMTKGGIFRRSKRNDEIDEISRSNVKVIMSKFEILMNNKGLVEQNKIKKSYHNVETFDRKKMFYEHIGFNSPKVMIYIITIGLFYILGQKYFINHTITYSSIVLYLGLINALDNGSREIIELYKVFAKNFQRIEKLWNTFDNFKPILGYSIGSKFQSSNLSIKLTNISYGYNESSQVFKNFSLTIQGGKKTALVGPSGGGKSTLIKLIAGYLHPQSGEILVDNQALPTPQNIESGDHISLQSYYPHIGYLTQEPSVFDGTIRENLTYGMTEAQQDQDLEQTIDQVIKLSKCEFIYEFKDGLQTEIGEKGVRLSGGQRQRLAIAKIMLKNPSIILLDEPTSALDSYNEEQVTQALNNLFQGKTVIIIAHRLQTVKNADEILYIAKDETTNSSIIIECGTHAQLLELKGEYHTMVELQSGF